MDRDRDWQAPDWHPIGKGLAAIHALFTVVLSPVMAFIERHLPESIYCPGLSETRNTQRRDLWRWCWDQTTLSKALTE